MDAFSTYDPVSVHLLGLMCTPTQTSFIHSCTLVPQFLLQGSDAFQGLYIKYKHIKFKIMLNTPTLYLSVCHTFHGYRACTCPGKPGKSWDVILTFSQTGKRPLVLESSGNMLTSTKKIWSVWKAVKGINIWDLGSVLANLNFKALEKSIGVLEKSWKLVSKKGYEPCG